MAAWTYRIDPSHSGVHFTVRHLVFSKVRGSFATFSGTIHLDEESPAASSVEASIDAKSVDTRDEKRDGHLRSADFFDVEKHPAITFKSTSVESTGAGLRVTGDLQIRGTTKEVVLDVERLGTGRDPWGGERIGFAARTAIDRRDFGLTWNQALETGGVLVGERVEIELDIQAVKTDGSGT